jgi:hypothetical protein
MAKGTQALDPSTALPEVHLSAEDSALADGANFPSRSQVIFRWLDAPDTPRVVIELAVFEQQPIVTSFSLDSRDQNVDLDLTPLRSMPHTKFRDMAIRYALAYRAERDSDRARAEGRRLTHEEFDSQWHSLQTALNTVRRRRDITDELLQRVAQVYNSDTSGKPTAAVAEAEYMSHRNAGRLISVARDRGYIAPVSKRQSAPKEK